MQINLFPNREIRHIEGFKERPYQEEYSNNVIDAFEQGCVKQLTVSPTGCHAPGQGILLKDGSVKRVEDIRVGDKLVGPDGEARTVKVLHSGIGEMYNIIPIKGEPFCVNADHVLSLKGTSLVSGIIKNITVKDYISSPLYYNNHYRLYRAGVESFHDPARQLIVDSFTVKYVGRGKYYGFEVDKDNLYLLDDFTVTHNSGKTYCAMRLFERLGMNSMLFLAHREELISQARKTAEMVFPNMKVGVEMADMWADDDCQIIVASIPSLGKKTGLKRLSRFHPERFNMLFVDEAHHSTASTYTNLLKYFKPEIIIGTTATVRRGDGTPLANVYDKVTFSRTLPELILEGEADTVTPGPYLCRFIGHRVKTNVDLSNIHIRAGDLAEGELAAACNVDGRNSKIISAVEQHADDRKCILVFAIDKQHAIDLAEQFNLRGHIAANVLGTTPKQERRDLIAKFQAGEIRVMVGCGVFTEGFDCPRIDTIVMARPTLSEGLFLQMIGRGARVFPGKPNCLVLDIADTLGKFGTMDIGEAFGVRGIDFLGEDVLEKSKIVKQAMDLGIVTQVGDTIEDVERKVEVIEKVVKGTVEISTQLEAVDVFESAMLEPTVEKESIFPWVMVGEEKYVLPMMQEGTVELFCDDLGIWSLTYGGETVKKDKSAKGQPFKWADARVKKLVPHAIWRAKKTSAGWQSKPVTEKQVNLLRRAYRMLALPKGLSRGEASRLLDWLKEAKKRGKRELTEYLPKSVAPAEYFDNTGL